MIHAITWILTFFVAAITSEGHQELQPDLEGCKSRGNSEAYHTNNRFINDPAIRETFFEFWLASRPDLPMSERREQGAWIVLNEEGKYEVIPFPDEWSASPCSIEVPERAIRRLPRGLAGVVHTHPFYEGDDTSPAKGLWKRDRRYL